jgi:nucleotide-binding universal stress UspA family protein
MMSPADRRPCIVVGYDGSDAARAAVRHAAERVGSGGLVVPIHAFGPPPDWLGHPQYQRLLDDHRSKGQEILDALLQEKSGLGDVELDPELLAGRPAELIVRVADSRDAQEIAVGSRGLGRVQGALGSVAFEVLHLADRPVLVVPERSIEGPVG